MAIGFGRLNFVQRSAGQNACAKSAYIGREKVHFHGNEFSTAKTYDWSHREKPIYNEILLPKHVSKDFLKSEFLWNAAEAKENRINSQTALELVFALPDDKEVSIEDKIELIRSYVQENYIDKGLAVQVVVHSPDAKIELNPETGEIEDLEHNWHAHVLVTTRRFKENGLELEDKKARDLMPVIRRNLHGQIKVVSGPDNGKLWGDHQNRFFESKGMDLRVDPTGIISQIHLGPLRMRGRAFALEEENQIRTSLNQIESRDPKQILAKITETKSVFNYQDVERFLQKHIDFEFIDEVREEFWKQEKLVQLFDPNSKEALDKFSMHEIIEEEKQILRIADRIHQSPAFKIKNSNDFTSKLNQEQKQAFDKIMQGQKLSCIEGHAGTGKSYLLASVREVYVNQGYTVRAFGPDNATADVLKEKGFTSSENIYRFLFCLHHGKREIAKSKEIWILDESSKLGNRPLLEFLKEAEKHQAQVIFAGCSSQLPSVERGGLFKTFCERYGAEELIEVQRQKNLEQRAMAKNLALGQMAQAIDRLTNLNGLKWSETKEESIEKLIKAWAVDQTAFSNESSLIIAHTNSEVRILNEMARLYRKEKGELEAEEYVCKAHQGKKIIVSIGDKIEFRQKDNKIGVQNGMRGTLINASENQFVVALQDSQRKISFNPNEYAGFQLGYATTYNRSQGQTLDRVYVLHSPQMNKEKLYVSLTRHAHRVNLYASYSDVSCVADLKRQAFRKSPRENTLQYTTEVQLKQQAAKEERQQSLEQLKESFSLLEKMKGYTLGAWDTIKGKIQEQRQHSKDLRPSGQFFNPDLKEATTKGQVVKINDQYLDYDQRQSIQQTFGKILEKVQPSFSQLSVANKAQESNWNKLSEQNKALLSQYYQTLNQSSVLYSLVKSEAKDQDLKTSPHFKEWQAVCATRNKHAYNVLSAVPQWFVREAIGKEAFNILQERASKHEAVLEKQNHSQLNLSEQLKEQIEPLLHRLFPDGPTGRDSKGLRFGSKGSLSIVCRGEEKGNFYDFEKREGGGPLKLVERALSLSHSEAIEWAKDFLGKPRELKVPSSYQFKSITQQNHEWNSLKPDPNHAAPSLKDLSSFLDQKYNEAARHAYHDEKGDLLFYVLRLVDKENPTKKDIRPLSYGVWQGADKPCWSLKGYQTDKRPLYHLDLLNKNPLAKVLIVEGEKTADAAGKLFANKNIICVTWQGGALAVSKSDWTPLHGRDAIIWPDNDEAGFKAADQICTALRQTGVKSLNVIDKDQLHKNFPEKWDLADPLPQGKTVKYLEELTLSAKRKSIGIDHLEFMFNDQKLTPEKLHAYEVLWRVEERMWPKLEERHGGRVWDIGKEILHEIQCLLSEQEKLDKKLQIHHHLSPELANRMAKQLTLQQAETSKSTNLQQIDELKQLIGSISQKEFKDGKDSKNSDLFMHAIDKSLGEALNLGLRTEVISKKIKMEMSENIQKVANQAKIQENLQFAEREQLKQKDRGIHLSL